MENILNGKDFNQGNDIMIYTLEKYIQTSVVDGFRGGTRLEAGGPARRQEAMRAWIKIEGVEKHGSI